jgi:hypothetical protein
MCPGGGVDVVEKSSIATAENQTPTSWSSNSHPIRCTVILLSFLLSRIRLILLWHTVVSQMVSMALLAPVFKMKLWNSTLDARDGRSNALPTVAFVKHIFWPNFSSQTEASSNVLVAGCAKGVDSSTIELGGRNFVLTLPKLYCSS